MSGADQLAPADDRATALSAQQPMKFLPTRVTRTKVACQCKRARPTALTADLAKVRVTQQQNGTDHDNR